MSHQVQLELLISFLNFSLVLKGLLLKTLLKGCQNYRLTQASLVSVSETQVVLRFLKNLG